MAAYVLEGPRWGTGAAGTSGGTVTWAIDSSVPAAFVSGIQAAFADWSAHANISFQQVGTTVLIASHDLALVKRMGKRVLVLDHGKLIDDFRPGA